MASEGSKQRLRYFPEVYNVVDENSARQIILTNDGEGADTATRWAAETPYLIELFQSTLNLRSDTLLLDYGCGIGRVSKAIIDAFGCSVIGLDASANMPSWLSTTSVPTALRPSRRPSSIRSSRPAYGCMRQSPSGYCSTASLPATISPGSVVASFRPGAAGS